MTKEEAVNYLIAYACCGLPVLQCDLDCPMYAGAELPCEVWGEVDIYEAIQTLKEET